MNTTLFLRGLQLVSACLHRAVLSYLVNLTADHFAVMLNYTLPTAIRGDASR